MDNTNKTDLKDIPDNFFVRAPEPLLFEFNREQLKRKIEGAPFPSLEYHLREYDRQLLLEWFSFKERRETTTNTLEKFLDYRYGMLARKAELKETIRKAQEELKKLENWK